MSAGLHHQDVGQPFENERTALAVPVSKTPELCWVAQALAPDALRSCEDRWCVTCKKGGSARRTQRRAKFPLKTSPAIPTINEGWADRSEHINEIRFV